MGYAGGTKANPTYYSLGVHSETVQINYDPAIVSYEDLLDVFWDSHSPIIPSFSRQYASIIFYHNEEQQKLAIASKEAAEARLGTPLYTEILPYNGFYQAEDYHQKYYLRQYNSIMKELLAIYPDIEDLLASTAAARLNGYAGGYGDLEALRQNITDLGLSPKSSEKLLDIAERGLVPGCAVPAA